MALKTRSYIITMELLYAPSLSIIKFITPITNSIIGEPSDLLKYYTSLHDPKVCCDDITRPGAPNAPWNLWILPWKKTTATSENLHKPCELYTLTIHETSLTTSVQSEIKCTPTMNCCSEPTVCTCWRIIPSLMIATAVMQLIVCHTES